MSANSPTVSIILCSYNDERFIAETIDNILNQTFTDFELIITDDASTDNSWEIIKSYTDPRIKAIREPRNWLTKNFVDAIHASQGKYLAIHHSGDLWNPDKLEKQVAWLDTYQEYVAVFTHVYGINETGAIVHDELTQRFCQPNRNRYEWLNFFFYNWNVLCHPSVLMRKKLARKIYTTFGPTTINDWSNWIRTCCEHEIYILQEKLTGFRRKNKDSSAGGHNLANFRKVPVETVRVLPFFRGIGSKEDWLKAFPQVKQYVIGAEFVADFALAMLCIEPRTDSAAFGFYGITLLFDLLANTESREKIEHLYHFGPKEMSTLTGSRDFFGCIKPTMAQQHAHLICLFADGSQTEPIQVSYQPDNNGFYSITFDLNTIMNTYTRNLSNPLKKIFFIPLMGQPCYHKLEQSNAYSHSFKFNTQNASSHSESWDTFATTTTPVYSTDSLLPIMRSLSISGYIREFNRDELLAAFTMLTNTN